MSFLWLSRAIILSLIFLGTEKELWENFIPYEVAEGLRNLQNQEPELMEKMFRLTEERFQQASYAHRAINDQTLSPNERTREIQRQETAFGSWEEKVWLPVAEVIYNKLVDSGVPPEFII